MASISHHLFLAALWNPSSQQEASGTEVPNVHINTTVNQGHFHLTALEEPINTNHV